MKSSLFAIYLLAGVAPDSLMAQAVSPPDSHPATQAAPIDTASEDDPASEGEEQEIVVTGTRQPARGAVVGDIQPEVQFSRATILAFGINSVSELLAELAPQIRSDRGRGGEAPIILLNGRRTSGFAEVRDIPAEAISRAEILPEEVALKYGYSSDQRVVNIVLRKRFHAVIAEAGDRFATDGGHNVVDPNLTYLEINHDRRINIAVKYQNGDDLTESARNIIPFAPHRPYDVLGNLTALTPSGEIDPALSALAGQTVTIAGVPALAATRAPSLADLVATANAANVTDTTAYRTLLPSDERASINASYSRNLLGNVAATLNGRLEATSGTSLLGLPGIKLVLPTGNPFSPFSNDVALYRYADKTTPLVRHTKGLDGHLGLILNSHAASWQWSLSGAYDHTENRTITDGRIDPTAIDAALRVDDPGVNPFAAFSSALLPTRLPDRTDQTSDAGRADATVNGSPFRLPSGKVLTSIRVGASWTAISGQSRREGTVQDSAVSRSDVNGQLSVDIPITSRRNNFLAALGNLSINGNVAVRRLSDFGTLRTFGYGLVWSPVPPLRIIASASDDDGPPTPLQVGAPSLLTPNARVYDFARGETVEASRIEGGNAVLSGDNHRVLKIAATWKPGWAKGLSINANYLHSRTRDAIVSIAVTSALEAAFPDRFVRDVGGNLLRFDARPVNIRSDNREELRWGINLLKAFGATIPSPVEQSAGAASTSGPSRIHGVGLPGRRMNASRLSFAIYHTWHLRHDVLVRDGFPILDLLNGDTIAMNGGDPRHEIEAQAGIFRSGIGLRMSANWRSATTVKRMPGLAATRLSFSSLTTANLRLFVNFGQQDALVRSNPWLQGLRLTASVDNILNGRPRVVDEFGATPYVYQPAYLDPLGRTIRLSIRKAF